MLYQVNLGRLVLKVLDCFSAPTFLPKPLECYEYDLKKKLKVFAITMNKYVGWDINLLLAYARSLYF